MRVLLDTTFALRGPSGTGVYLERLARALPAAGVEVVEARNPARRAPAGGGWRSWLNLATDAWWVQVELPRRARAAGADVLHHPLPAHGRLGSCPQVVTVHDLAFEALPERFDSRFRRWASRTHRSAARRADAVVCVSRSTAREAISRWSLEPERVRVARHGPGQEPGLLRPRGDARWLLYVGDDEPRKNLPLLLEAYARYRAQAQAPLPLVLAGSARARADGVEVVERPEAERLAELYASAAALVHPALHEGFGLTALEAMNAGTPVLAVANAAVEEVCGDAALLVEARSDALAAEIGRVAADAALRRDLCERGRRRAAEFSWTRSARAHAEAYELAVRLRRRRFSP